MHCVYCVCVPFISSGRCIECLSVAVRRVWLSGRGWEHALALLHPADLRADSGGEAQEPAARVRGSDDVQKAPAGMARPGHQSAMWTSMVMEHLCCRQWLHYLSLVYSMLTSSAGLH